MSAEFTINRELAGAAKNLLDDLMTLDTKIPQELERGVRESYLEVDKVTGLAERLGVEAPRIRTRRWVYVEQRVVQSYAVEAYDDDDAKRIFLENFEQEIRRGNIPYGVRQSHWADRVDRNSIMISEPTTQRPTMNHNLRFYVERRGEPRPLRAEPESVPEQSVAQDQTQVFDELTLATMDVPVRLEMDLTPLPRWSVTPRRAT